MIINAKLTFLKIKGKERKFVCWKSTQENSKLDFAKKKKAIMHMLCGPGRAGMGVGCLEGLCCVWGICQEVGFVCYVFSFASH